MKIELQKARRYAEKIVSELNPWCQRIEIAGSIRRKREFVGDIDLVIEPKPGQLQAIKDRCMRGGPNVMVDGNQNFLIMMVGNIQLDIFFARQPVADMFNPKPGNFGSLMVCRTGSVEHNIWLIAEAKRRGLAWLPYEGVLKEGRIIAGDEETDIFKALGLDYVNPEQRERK